MKILFTGPLLDFSGFAHCSRNFLQTLYKSGVELSARALTYDALDSKDQFQSEPWLEKLLANDIQGVDLAIQMTTCNQEAVPVAGVCNALYTFIESDRIQPSWAAKANEFDFLLVPCRANAMAMLRSGVKKPVMVVAPPCDKEVFNKSYQPYDIKNAGERTIFYNICQLSSKKGIDSLLRAYFAAFADKPDEVLLVLKTYINMQDRSKDLAHVKQYIDAVKAKCRIPVNQFPPVMPIISTMSDDEIHGLHIRGDAYVCSSRAEGWGLPVFDAMCHGNTVITNAAGGLEGFVRPESAILYNGQPTLFYDCPHPDPGLFTGVEQCFEPNIPEMSMLMRNFHLLREGSKRGVLNEENQKEWNSILDRRIEAEKLKDKFDCGVVHGMIMPKIKEAYDSWTDNGKVIFKEQTDGQ